MPSSPSTATAMGNRRTPISSGPGRPDAVAEGHDADERGGGHDQQQGAGRIGQGERGGRPREHDERRRSEARGPA